MCELKEDQCCAEKKGIQQVPLSQLWEQLPDDDRNEIGRVLGQMMIRVILPAERREGSHE